MGIIDEAGAKSIANWFKEKQDTPYIVTITDNKSPVVLNVKNTQERATLEFILMKNGIKYKVETSTFSNN
jgi:hypothetical protein